MVVADEALSAELVTIISYPTSASGIIVLLKTPTKYREFFPTLFVKTTDFQYSYHIWRAWYNGSYTMMAKPIRALELYYPMHGSVFNFFFTCNIELANVRKIAVFV